MYAVGGGGPGLTGWASMAADIAFAMAVSHLTGAHPEPKLLLLAPTSVDDIGASLVIAIGGR
jgi:Na+/H+ antiporter NhaA